MPALLELDRPALFAAHFALSHACWLVTYPLAGWLGAGLGIIALPLLYWLFSSIGLNITDTVATRNNHTLVTHGPYRWVRHPLYSVGTLLFVSIGLLAANWFIIVSSLLGLGMLMIRLPKEEAKLIERFGDEYRDYMKRTGTLLPRLKN